MKKFAIFTFLVSALLVPARVMAANISVAVSQPTAIKVTSIGTLISSTIGLILMIAGLAAFGYLIWGGIAWITSGGDKSQVEGAQKRIQAAIVGLFVVFAAWALMLLIQSFFGVTILGNMSITRPFTETVPAPACTDQGPCTAPKTCDSNCTQTLTLDCICK